MVVHRVRGGFLVVRDDGGDDRRVLFDRLGGASRHRCQLVLVVGAAVAEVVDEAVGDRVAADLAEPPVERAVQPRVRRRVVGGDGRPHASDDGDELGAFGRRRLTRRVPRDQALERGPRLGDLDRLGDA